jgi:hypothetical protein
VDISYSDAILATLKKFATTTGDGADTPYNTFVNYIPMNTNCPSFGPTEGPVSEIHETVRLLQRYKDANDKTLHGAGLLRDAYSTLADAAGELAQAMELSTQNMQDALDHLQKAWTDFGKIESMLTAPPATDNSTTPNA